VVVGEPSDLRLTTELIRSRLDASSCPLCGNGETARFFPSCFDTGRRLEIRECDRCQVAWQWPRVHAGIEESAKYFDAAYERNDAYFNNDAKETICTLYLDYLDGIVEDRGRLLDLGAGFGSFVNAARDRGWDAIGVEPSATGARRAKNQFPNIEIIHGALEDVPADLTFDVITMWDVVEHLDDPMDLLRQAGGRLRPGGLLVVETGNYESAERSQAGLDWWGYLSDHRWCLNPPALSRMLRDCGFSDVSVAPRCMRPQAKMPPWIPSRTSLAARIARRPWRAGYFSRMFAETEKMRASAPETFELSIFTVAARKAGEARPIKARKTATAG
jgi:SAM-dependent methyltransferase